MVGADQVRFTVEKIEVEGVARALVTFWKFVVALFETVAAAADVVAAPDQNDIVRGPDDRVKPIRDYFNLSFGPDPATDD